MWEFFSGLDFSWFLALAIILRIHLNVSSIRRKFFADFFVMLPSLQFPPLLFSRFPHHIFLCLTRNLSFLRPYSLAINLERFVSGTFRAAIACSADK